MGQGGAASPAHAAHVPEEEDRGGGRGQIGRSRWALRGRGAGGLGGRWAGIAAEDALSRKKKGGLGWFRPGKNFEGFPFF